MYRNTGVALPTGPYMSDEPTTVIPVIMLIAEPTLVQSPTFRPAFLAFEADQCMQMNGQMHEASWHPSGPHSKQIHLFLSMCRPTSTAQTPAEPEWKAGAPASPEHDLEWDGDAPAAGKLQPSI